MEIILYKIGNKYNIYIELGLINHIYEHYMRLIYNDYTLIDLIYIIKKTNFREHTFNKRMIIDNLINKKILRPSYKIKYEIRYILCSNICNNEMLKNFSIINKKNILDISSRNNEYYIIFLNTRIKIEEGYRIKLIDNEWYTITIENDKFNKHQVILISDTCLYGVECYKKGISCVNIDDCIKIIKLSVSDFIQYINNNDITIKLEKYKI